MPHRFNQTSWPPDGPHRELLEFLDAVHSSHGCRSMRDIGRTMHLSYGRVYEIVRGASLPVDEAQTRCLVEALVGPTDAETRAFSDQAAELLVKARRARDEADSTPRPAVSPEPELPTPAAHTLGDEEAAITDTVEKSPNRKTTFVALAAFGIVAVAILAFLRFVVPGPAPSTASQSVPEQPPAGAAAGAPSMRVTAQNPGGCSPNYLVEVTASGNDPQIVDKRLWIVSELYADKGRNDPNSLYFAKVPVILRDGKFSATIDGNTEPGVRKERYLLVTSPSDAANADLQLSLSSDRAHDDQYPDYRRTTLQLGNTEIATGPDLVQRC